MNAVIAREKYLRDPTLKAAIIYEDFEFAARTAALLERAAARSDEVMGWDIKPWRLDLLNSSSLAEAALAETADADLVVVALSKTHLLPEALLGWLDRWAERRQIRDAALMILCPEETAGPMSSWSRLKELADWRGLLFLDSRHLSEGQEAMDIVHHLGQGTRPVNPAISWAADPPQSPRHWGINE